MWTRFYFSDRPDKATNDQFWEFVRTSDAKRIVQGSSDMVMIHDLSDGTYYVQVDGFVESRPPILCDLDIWKVMIVRRNIKPTMALDGAYAERHYIGDDLIPPMNCTATAETIALNGVFVQNITASCHLAGAQPSFGLKVLHSFHSLLCQGTLKPEIAW